MSSASRLMLLPFLQNWDGDALSFRLLVAPQTNPLVAPAPGMPPYATTDFDVIVRVIADPTSLPTPASAAVTEVGVNLPSPQNANALFEALNAALPIDSSVGPVDPRTSSVRIMKYAPPAYRDATGYSDGSNPFLLTDDTYRCALKAVPPAGTSVASSAPPLSWGQVLASVLRQPLLAEAVGLVRPINIDLPASVIENGGWVYVDLNAAGLWSGLNASPGAIRLYASRIPTLNDPRPLFSPVLFPVTPAPITGYDQIFAEAMRYDDGFAKEVYGAQPAFADPLEEERRADTERPATEHGLFLGWDDEQLVTWFNRQLDPGAASLDAPMGVRGYRVDARRHGETTWHALTMGETSVKLGPIDLGSATANFPVEVGPNKLLGDTSPNMWLPSYFTSWDGRPMSGVDRLADRLMGGDNEPEPVVGQAPDVNLRYGETYDVRVRLSDLTGGGPDIDDDSLNAAVQSIFTTTMRRFVRPGGPRLQSELPPRPDPDNPPSTITVRKPRLGFPACLLAGGDVAALETDIAAATADGRAPGLPDPDVDSLQITVEVLRPDVDPVESTPVYDTLYTVIRPFLTSGTVTLDIEWRDVADIFDITAPAAGAIVLPTSRNIRLNLTPLCSDKPNYFGADDVRWGQTSQVHLRKPAEDERSLLALPRGFAAEGFYLQPEEPFSLARSGAKRAAGAAGEGAEDPLGRFALELDLDRTETAIRARPGERCLFGAHPSLNAVIGPDGASIRFATATEIASRWIVVTVLSVERDWTWDGLKALRVERDGETIGRVMWRRTAGHEVAHSSERGRTRLIFLDAIDPEPAPGAFPRPIEPTYRLVPEFKVEPSERDMSIEAELTLPVAYAPKQTPKIVSAGIALSPYQRDEAYSSSEERTRMVWIEFDRPPDDENDAYFARVLASSPDPVLTGDLEDDPSVTERPLPIDAELIRRITPGQADDRSGLGAMQRLTPTDSPLHYVLPLPPGLSPDAPELFGFFLYEFRVGHASMWSTAQGRFGRPLQVAGVQHAPPPLVCGVSRTRQRLIVSAGFADPVREGRSVQPVAPRTELWALLYGQTVQADNDDRRNVLLGHRRLTIRRKPGAFRTDLLRPVFTTSIEETSGRTSWSSSEITSLLADITLGPDAPLSCIVVETLPGEQPWGDPLGRNLGYERILRTSPLTKIPEIC